MSQIDLPTGPAFDPESDDLTSHPPVAASITGHPPTPWPLRDDQPQPAGTRGNRQANPDPNDFASSETAKALKVISGLRQLRNETCGQTVEDQRQRIAMGDMMKLPFDTLARLHDFITKADRP